MKLTLISTSDTHGFILPTNYIQRHQNLPFGLVKAAEVIQKIKNEATGPVLTIENGDFLQGSPLAYYVARQLKPVSPAPLVEAYNLIPYDLSVLGNHEFNYGEAYLKKAVHGLNRPVCSANVLNDENEPAFGPAYQIFEKDGLKIAVLGLTTPYIPHWENPQNIQGLHFESAVKTAKYYVPLLHQKADIVVVSYHGGFERDLKTGTPTETITGENEGYQLLKEVKGIDALITGHQHRQIASQLFDVPITQPGYRGAFVGKIELDLVQDVHKKWIVKDSSAEIISVADEKSNQLISEKVSLLQNQVENWLDQPLGQVKGDMSIKEPAQARIDETPYVEFINKVQMWATQTDISGTAIFNNEASGFNQEITMRNVVTNYIYPNTLAVLKVSGAELKAALERSASYFIIQQNGELGINPRFADPKPQHYNYDMYEGIDYTLDIQKPFGQRVTRLNYHKKAIQENDQLEIVVNQYRAGGGGNYPMFSTEKIVREVQKDMTELIADYLKEHPIIEATANHNFTIKY